MKKHTSYRGNKIDMELLKFQNQHKVAVGNAKMNARGDIIGRGGTVIKKREDILAERERELQKPDVNSDQLRQITPQSDNIDDGFDDSMFENAPADEQAEEVKKVAPVPQKRNKSKDADKE